MAIAEHETTVAYDYLISQVRLYTTRQGVAAQIRRRVGDQANIVEGRSGDRVVSWQITLSMSACRGAAAITKVLKENHT